MSVKARAVIGNAGFGLVMVNVITDVDETAIEVGANAFEIAIGSPTIFVESVAVLSMRLGSRYGLETDTEFTFGDVELSATLTVTTMGGYDRSLAHSHRAVCLIVADHQLTNPAQRSLWRLWLSPARTSELAEVRWPFHMADGSLLDR